MTSVDEQLARGRSAIEHSDWHAAAAAFAGADQVAPLGIDDLQHAALAATWIGDVEACIELRQRAFALASRAGDDRRCAALAIDLCTDHARADRITVATGWMQRAERLLDGAEPCSELGGLVELRALIAMELEQDFEKARSHFEEVRQIGETCGDADLVAVGMVGVGRIDVWQGNVAQGMRLVDEAMTDAVSGCLGPIATARMYCVTISLCQALGDLRRASEWTEQAIVCARRPGMGDFPGDCRMHRAEITRLRGDWDQAEAELRAVMDDLGKWHVGHVAHARYELGEIALRRGDFTAARAAFTRAQSDGKDPQPGLAMLLLAEGDDNMASAQLRVALDNVPAGDPLAAAPLLPAIVEVQLACDDDRGATEAAERLEALAARFETVVLQARAATARAQVALARGMASDALTSARAAVNLWRDAGAPYEAAQAQCLAGRAAAQTGDAAVAAVELDAAVSVFTALGATRDVMLAGETRSRLGAVEGGRRVRRTFMFTDMVDSTRLVAAMGDGRWSAVLRSHDRTVRDQLARHHGAEIKQRGGGDGFFVVFDEPADGVACAIAIQRGFAEQRAATGFAPDVRIGVHQTEALVSGNDYAGLGVHEAARIAELAGAGEILSSASTLAATPGVTCEPEHDVTVKGLADPVTIRRVTWEAP